MTINSNVQAPVKLSAVEEIIDAIEQLSSTERTVLVLKLKRLGLFGSKPIVNPTTSVKLYDSDLNLESLPYVVSLSDDKPIDEQLDEIWQKRGPINWSNIDDISEKMSIEEPIEELLQTLNS